MKNLIIVLVFFTMIIACKKDESEIEASSPDYSKELEGTYVGHETYAGPASGNILHDDPSKTLTITKVERNKIRTASFYDGSAMTFTLSNGTSSIVLTPSSPMEAQGANSYIMSTKTLRIYYKNSVMNRYYYFQGTKQ